MNKIEMTIEITRLKDQLVSEKAKNAMLRGVLADIQNYPHKTDLVSDWCAKALATTYDTALHGNARTYIGEISLWMFPK